MVANFLFIKWPSYFDWKRQTVPFFFNINNFIYQFVIDISLLRLFTHFVVAETKPEFYSNNIRHGGTNGGVLLTLKGKGEFI